MWKSVDNNIQLVTLQWSEFMGEYNTLDAVVRDRSSKSVMK